MTASPTTAAERFRDRNITFANGSVGQNIDIPSASPINYHQVISNPAAMPPVTVDGKLFLPASSGAANLARASTAPGRSLQLGVAFVKSDEAAIGRPERFDRLVHFGNHPCLV